MNIHIQNVGECQKCGLIMTSFFSKTFSKKNRINLTDSPKKCDLLIILGCPLKSQVRRLIKFWQLMPLRYKILNFGNCGTENQDLFDIKNQHLKNKAIKNGYLPEILPLDFYIEGCPPTINQLEVFFTRLKKSI